MIQNTSVKHYMCYNIAQLNTQVWCQNFKFKPWGDGVFIYIGHWKSSRCKHWKKNRKKNCHKLRLRLLSKKGEQLFTQFYPVLFYNWFGVRFDWQSYRNSTISFIQLFRERLSEKMCPARKGNNTVPDFVALEPHFCCFPLVLANTRLWPAVWPLMPFFQICSRDCHVHSFRQPFST